MNLNSPSSGASSNLLPTESMLTEYYSDNAFLTRVLITTLRKNKFQLETLVAVARLLAGSTTKRDLFPSRTEKRTAQLMKSPSSDSHSLTPKSEPSFPSENTPST